MVSPVPHTRVSSHQEHRSPGADNASMAGTSLSLQMWGRPVSDGLKQRRSSAPMRWFPDALPKVPGWMPLPASIGKHKT